MARYTLALASALLLAGPVAIAATPELPGPARLLPLPLLPQAGSIAVLRVIDRAREFPSRTPYVYLYREDAPATPIRLQVIRTSDGAVVYTPPLRAGQYHAEYYDTYASPNYTDGPKVATDFHVSAQGPVTLVEFHNPSLDHYFITANAAEIDALDSGRTAGWVRTGESFRALPPGELASYASPVCRFYGLPSAGLDSHFYSQSQAECDEVASRYPNQWLRETSEAFGVLTAIFPVTCEPDAGRRLYRLYNNRADANHRYTTSRTIVDEMTARGWTLEAAPYDSAYEPSYSMCVLP